MKKALFAVLVIGLFAGCYAPKKTEQPTQPAQPAETEAASEEAPEPEVATTTVTLDGYDSGELVTPVINLWKDYDNRAAGVAGKAKHGQKVEMIERKGDGVLIETDSGVKGWVTYYFIKELK